jgi:hypothetical protein
MSENGKGDAPRPMVVSKEVYDINHARIFGKKLKWWEKRKLLPDDVVEEPDHAPSKENRKD